MSDKSGKSDAQKLFDALAKGETISAPAAPPRSEKTEKPENAARALFDSLATANTPPPTKPPAAPAPPPPDPLAPSTGRAIMEDSGDPRFAPPPPAAVARPRVPPPAKPAPPTIPQQMASPIVRGVSAMGDLGSLAAAGVMKVPSPFDLAGLSPRSAAYDKFKAARTQMGDQFLENTGDQGTILRGARAVGAAPENPSWKPESGPARALHNTTDLATQFLAGGLFSRAYNAFKGALDTVPKFMPGGAPGSGAMPTQVSRNSLGPLGPAPAMKRDLAAAGIGGVSGAIAHGIGGDENAESLAMAGGSMLPYVSASVIPKTLVNIADRASDFFRAPDLKRTANTLAERLGSDPRALYERYVSATNTELPFGSPLVMAPPKGQPQVPGWSQSPGSVMDHSGLLGMERRMADDPTPLRDPLTGSGRISPADLRARNAEALQQNMRDLAPPGDPLAATGVMGERIQALKDFAARRAATLNAEAQTREAQANTAQRAVEGLLPPTAPGERVRARTDAARQWNAELNTTENAMVTQGGALFNRIDPEGAATVPLYRIRDALDEVNQTAIRRGHTAELPSIMRKPLDAQGAPIGDKIDDYLHSWQQAPANPQFLANVPFERVKGLRERLTTLQRKADTPIERGFLGTLIKGVDNAVLESSAGDLGRNYVIARDFWRENVAKPFREGPVSLILKNDREYTGAGTILAPGERGGENVKQLVATIENNPGLWGATNNYIRADMTAFATDVHGRVNGAKLKEWVDKHTPVLDQFPALRQEFDRIASAQRVADQYMDQAAERSPQLRLLAEKGIKNTEDAVRKGAAKFYFNAEPEDVVRKIVALPGGARAKAAEQTMAMLPTQEAREGLQRAYYNYVQKRALGGADRPDVKGGWKNGFTNMLDKEADVAEHWLPPKVRDNMRNLDEAISREGARDRARANEGSRTAEDGTIPFAQRIAIAIAKGLPAAAGAAAGAVAGSAAGPVGTILGAVSGAAGPAITQQVIAARVAAREAALREMVFNKDLFERGMSEVSLSPHVKRQLHSLIRPYVLLANEEAVTDQVRETNRGRK